MYLKRPKCSPLLQTDVTLAGGSGALVLCGKWKVTLLPSRYMPITVLVGS